MRELLSTLINRKIDLRCDSTTSLRGEVVKLENDVLHLRDEDGQMCYVSVEHISVVYETRDHAMRAGFIPSTVAGEK